MPTGIAGAIFVALSFLIAAAPAPPVVNVQQGALSGTSAGGVDTFLPSTNFIFGCR